jgi:hypothetical protein
VNEAIVCRGRNGDLRIHDFLGLRCA